MLDLTPLFLCSLNCRLPVLRRKKALAEVNGHQVLSFDTRSDRFVFLIEKGKVAA